MKTARDEKIGQALETLKQGIANVTTSERWREYLAVQAKFHEYSFNNALMILFQCPRATQVAGYKAWQKLGRQVRRGEVGMRIFAPCPFKKLEVNKETGEETACTVMRYRLVSVFDISQTDGEPLPEPCSSIQGDDAQGYIEDIVEVAKRLGARKVDIVPQDINGRFYQTECRIVVNSRMSANQQVKTLIHETAHMILEHATAGLPYELAELEAESVAYVVTQHLGIDAGDFSFGYIATWASGGDKAIEAIKRHGSRIQQAARRLIECISEEHADEQEVA